MSLQNDMEMELEYIDKAILEHKLRAQRLIERRYELLAQKEDVQLQDLVDYVVERGLSAKEVLTILSSVERE